jgi:hypothetical protein
VFVNNAAQNGLLSAILLDMSDKRKRSITPLMVGHPLDEQNSFDRTAEHFFTEGKAHEERGWEDVLPLDDEPEPKRRGGSIDKLPRRWSAIFALVALCICLVAGAAAVGFALFAKGPVFGPMATLRSWLSVTSEASRESIAGPTPNPIPPQTPSETTTAPLGPAPTPGQALPSSPGAVAPASEAFAIPAKVPRLEAKTDKTDKTEQAAPLPDVEGQERLRKDALAIRGRRHRSQPRDNYIWSTELNALVPTSSMQMGAQPPSQSDAATGRPPTFESPR